MNRKLGKYTILEEIGRGGMAVVYKARQESLDRIVAIKELSLSRTSWDRNAAHRFRLEAKAAASLDHPGIITVHDFWEKGKKAYIAMEFVEGMELKEVLDAFGAVDPVLAALVVQEVCSALKYAHARGIIHRDVKPGNIMLSARGDVKLADFGIVSVSGTADLTTTGAVIGTPSYMSPEQIRGEKLGPTSDIFSLGIVLYEAVTGSKPFIAPNDVALTHAIMRHRPIHPRRLNSSVPRRLGSVIKKCLKKKPRKRYLTMDELFQALQRALPRKVPDRTAEISRLVAKAKRIGEPDSTIPATAAKGPRRFTRFASLAGLTIILTVAIVLAVPSSTFKNSWEIFFPPSPRTNLTIVAYPWAEIILDDRSRGYTPIAYPMEVSPGNHILILKNPYFGERSFELDLSPGRSTPVNVDFLEGKP